MQIIKNIFNWMSIGLMTTGFISYLVASNIDVETLFHYHTILYWIILLTPLILTSIISDFIEKLSVVTVKSLYLTICGMFGICIGFILTSVTLITLIGSFLGTVTLFTTVTIMGYTSKKDLTKLSNILICSLIGIIVVSLFNIFFAVPLLNFIIDIIYVIIFTGFTMYNMNKLKKILPDTEKMTIEEIKKTEILMAYNFSFFNSIISSIFDFSR